MYIEYIIYHDRMEREREREKVLKGPLSGNDDVFVLL